MPWVNPKTDWSSSDVPQPSSLNRIEGNIAELKKAATIDIADAAGNFVADNVEGALQELAGNVGTGKGSVAAAIVDMGQTADPSMTFAELAAKIRAISSDATAAVGEVLTGKTFYQGGGKKTGTMPNRGAVTITPGQTDQAIAAGYHSGAGKVVGDADLVAGNVKTGVNLFGVAGSFTGDATAAAGEVLTGKTAYVAGNKVTGTMPNQGAKILTPGTANVAIPAGYHSGAGYVQGDADLKAVNIKEGVNVFGVVGSMPDVPFAKYTKMRFLQNLNAVSYGKISMSPDGTYCLVGTRTGLTLYCYKRSGDAWTQCWSTTLDQGTGAFADASWTSDGNYFLALNGVQNYAGLYKRSGDSFSRVGSVAPPYTTMIGLTKWDTTNTYCIGYAAGRISLLKRTGDAIAEAATLGISYGRVTFCESDDALQYVAIPTYNSGNGTSTLVLISRSGDTLSVASTNSIDAGELALMSHSGNYALGVSTTGNRVTLYRRSGTTLTEVLYAITTSTTYSNGARVAELPSDANVFLITTPTVSGSSYGGDFFVYGIDEAAEKIRFVTARQGGMIWGQPYVGGITLMGDASYSLNGAFLGIVCNRSSGNYEAHFYKVGELS